MAMRVLVTGFEAYWDYTINSSWEVACKIEKHCMPNVEIIVRQMPVRFASVAKALRRDFEMYQPDLILMLGQSGGSNCVKLERTALNLMDAHLPDNDGFIPVDQAIDNNDESAYFTNCPIKLLLTALQEKKIESKISNSCGLYVCNRLYYEALKISKTYPNVSALFVHLPFYEGQPTAKIGKPTMKIEKMITATETIINIIHGQNRTI